MVLGFHSTTLKRQRQEFFNPPFSCFFWSPYSYAEVCLNVVSISWSQIYCIKIIKGCFSNLKREFHENVYTFFHDPNSIGPSIHRC